MSVHVENTERYKQNIKEDHINREIEIIKRDFARGPPYYIRSRPGKSFFCPAD